MFGTDLGWGVDDLLNQPCDVAEKSLEGRNQLLKKKIKIVSVKTIFAFFYCDSQGHPINVIIAQCSEWNQNVQKVLYLRNKRWNLVFTGHKISYSIL